MTNKTMLEIEKEVYGVGGLYDRVIAEIKKVSVRETSRITGKTTQNVYKFTVKNDKSKPKLETIIMFSKALGVE